MLLGSNNLTMAQVIAVGREHEPVKLSKSVRADLAKTRALIECKWMDDNDRQGLIAMCGLQMTSKKLLKSISSIDLE